MTNEQLEKANELQWKIQNLQRYIEWASCIKLNTCININIQNNSVHLKIPSECVVLIKTTLIDHYKKELDILSQEFDQL